MFVSVNRSYLAKLVEEAVMNEEARASGLGSGDGSA